MTTGSRRSRARRATMIALAAATASALGMAGCGGEAEPSAQAAAQTATAATGDTTPRRRLRTLELESQLAAAAKGTRTGSAPGGQMVFTGMLFEPGGDAAIGRSQGSCTRTAAGAGEVFQCLLAFVLDDGTIYAQSMASAQGPANGVVTGGTGGFAYVQGTFRYRANGTPRVNLTLRLGS